MFPACFLDEAVVQARCPRPRWYPFVRLDWPIETCFHSQLSNMSGRNRSISVLPKAASNFFSTLPNQCSAPKDYR